MWPRINRISLVGEVTNGQARILPDVSFREVVVEAYDVRFEGWLAPEVVNVVNGLLSQRIIKRADCIGAIAGPDGSLFLAIAP